MKMTVRVTRTSKHFSVSEEKALDCVGMKHFEHLEHLEHLEFFLAPKSLIRAGSTVLIKP